MPMHAWGRAPYNQVPETWRPSADDPRHGVHDLG